MEMTIKKRSARDAELRLKNRRTGVAIFQISWIMAFVCLIMVNLQLRSASPGWPPEGVQPLNPLLPTLGTIGLLTSVWLARRGYHAVQTDDRQGFTNSWRAALALGAFFVAVMVFEWVTLPPVRQEIMVIFGEDSIGPVSQFNAIFRVMTAFHGVHALVIGLYMWQVLKKASAYGSHDSWDVEAGAKLWYFVVVAWIMFYTVLYII